MAAAVSDRRRKVVASASSAVDAAGGRGGLDELAHQGGHRRLEATHEGGLDLRQPQPQPRQAPVGARAGESGSGPRRGARRRAAPVGSSRRRDGVAHECRIGRMASSNTARRRSSLLSKYWYSVRSDWPASSATSCTVKRVALDRSSSDRGGAATGWRRGRSTARWPCAATGRRPAGASRRRRRPRLVGGRVVVDTMAGGQAARSARRLVDMIRSTSAAGSVAELVAPRRAGRRGPRGAGSRSRSTPGRRRRGRSGR